MDPTPLTQSRQPQIIRGEKADFLVIKLSQLLHPDKYPVQEPHLLISICDPDQEKKFRQVFDSFPPPAERKASIRLNFADADDEFMADSPHKFTSAQAEQILAFVGQNADKAKLIVCQCIFGQNRSPAVAAALSKLINGDDTELVRKYRALNIHVYRMLLEAGQDRFHLEDFRGPRGI